MLFPFGFGERDDERIKRLLEREASTLNLAAALLSFHNMHKQW